MIDFITQKDDYENWKEQVLPFLDENQLNVVISHGYYIKKLNNVSNSRAGNLDASIRVHLCQ